MKEETMFGFFHPYILLQWYWFVFVTDRAAYNTLKKTDAKKFALIQDQISQFALYVQSRRLKRLEEQLIAEETSQRRRVAECRLVEQGLRSNYAQLNLHFEEGYRIVEKTFVTLVDDHASGKVSNKTFSDRNFVHILDSMILSLYKRGMILYDVGSRIEKLNQTLEQLQNTR